MKIEQVNNAAGHRISEGSQYMWKCYGNYARFLDYVDIAGQHYLSAIFDANTQRIYQLEIWVPGQEQAFRWHDPEFRQDYLDEAAERHVEPDRAWDELKFTIVDDPATILEYAQNVGQLYYDDLPIPEDPAPDSAPEAPETP